MLHELRETAAAGAMYANAAARVFARGRRADRSAAGGRDGRLVFVVGSPRSGTTFLGRTLGSQPGFVDLDEVQPLKAALPRLAALPEAEQARRLRRTLEAVRRLGLVARLRGVEQTPETGFVLRAAFRAYPDARAIHMVRDGRDVVCSLLERGWLSARRAGADDAGHGYGAHPRFWVEPDRREEFTRVSDARRCAWAWRCYASAVRAVEDERVVEVRYEDLPLAAGPIAAHLGIDRVPLAEALTDAHAGSIGRWRDDLEEQQLADVLAEAGPLLAELGYLD